MPRSLSILSFAAALGLAGAAVAQDSSATDTTKDDTATQQPAADATASDSMTDAANDTAADSAKDNATEPADAGSDFSTGTEVQNQPAQDPQVYIKEKFDDWSLRCFRNKDGEDPCQLYQLLHEKGGNPVAEFSVFKIEGQAPAVAGATAIVPLVTLLPAELKLSVDGGPAKSYPYRTCTQAGCIAQIGLTAQDLAALKKGAKAQLELVPAQAPDQKIKVDISLKGFTAGYDAVGSFTK